MTDRALVIGIDHHANAAWKLRAAVRDAVAFAKWVTEPGAGRASPETLTLLLAPDPDRPVKELPYRLADGTAIKKALIALKDSGADGAERLWFFYAGHGIAPSGSGPDQAPLIVPCDETDIDLLRSFPIDLSSWIRTMQVYPPKHQLWFVDACRGIIESEDLVSSQQAFFFDLSKSSASSLQAVHFATTAGALAKEISLHGLFGRALASGLAGSGPKLRPTDAGVFELTLGALAEYTKKAMKEKGIELKRMNKEMPTQEPWISMSGDMIGHILARFPEEPRVPLRVLVDPAVPVPDGIAFINVYDSYARKWDRKLEKKIAVPVTWNLAADDHLVEIAASEFEIWRETVSLIGEKEMEAKLAPLSTLESLGVYPPAPPSASPLQIGDGALSVETFDRYASIELFDDKGDRVATGLAELFGNYPVGQYRVEVTLPSERRSVRIVSVTHEEPAHLKIRPDPSLTRSLPPSAALFQPNEGYTNPSEVFGDATTTHLGSLLAWAASAAQYPTDGFGQKLRSLGVLRAQGETHDCLVRVLVGDTRVPNSYKERQGPIESLSLKIGDLVAQPFPVSGLDGYAVQWLGAVGPGSSLLVAADGLSPKRFPLPVLAGHIWTFVIARETTQRIEIHRYLDPIKPEKPFNDTIRLVEHSWRALDAREPLAEGEADRLLDRSLDPLALVVLGYRLLRENRFDLLKAVLEKLAGANLADVPILEAGIDNRDEHMARALQFGRNALVGDGFRALDTWLTENFARERLPPPHWPEPVTGGFWTSFDTRGQTIVSKAFPIADAPSWASKLLPAALATAGIRSSGPDEPIICTGFLVTPRRIAIASHSVSEGGFGDLNTAIADFDGTAVQIEEIVGTIEPELDTVTARITSVHVAPAKLRLVPPDIGTRIAIIGFPKIDFHPTLMTLAQFAIYPAGKKMIMPGVIVDVTSTTLTYECWTMAGVSGGPIVDLDTGEVIGMHLRGKFMGGTRKLGWGVPLAAIANLLGAVP